MFFSITNEVSKFKKHVDQLYMYISDVNECESNPCLNNGECVDGIDTFSCNCGPHFSGDNCGLCKWTRYCTYYIFVLNSKNLYMK